MKKAVNNVLNSQAKSPGPDNLQYMHCTGSNTLLMLPETGLRFLPSTLDLLYIVN